MNKDNLRKIYQERRKEREREIKIMNEDSGKESRFEYKYSVKAHISSYFSKMKFACMNVSRIIKFKRLYQTN